MKKLLLSVVMLLPLALFAQNIVEPEFEVQYRTYQQGPNWVIEIAPDAAAEIRASGYRAIFNKSASYTIVYTDNYSIGVVSGQIPPRGHQVPPGDEENVFIQINSAGDGFWGRYDWSSNQPYPSY